MHRFVVKEVLGNGTYGVVYRAFNKANKREVAIKKMNATFTNFQDCYQLREVVALLHLREHTNVVKVYCFSSGPRSLIYAQLLEVIKENDRLYLVFEFMETTLCRMLKSQHGPLSESMIRSLMYQCLKGVEVMHDFGFMHRDIKPENLLIAGSTIKLADFGLARFISNGPPFTEYCSTRWYRAPELLFHNKAYTKAVDMWAIGTIMAELFLNKPLFPGTTEIEQIRLILRVLGTPAEWPAQFKLPLEIMPTVPKNERVWEELFPNASPEARQLVRDLLSLDPAQRPTAKQALQYPFFMLETAITESAPLLDGDEVDMFNELPPLVQTSVLRRNRTDFPCEI